MKGVSHVTLSYLHPRRSSKWKQFNRGVSSFSGRCPRTAYPEIRNPYTGNALGADPPEARWYRRVNRGARHPLGSTPTSKGGGTTVSKGGWGKGGYRLNGREEGAGGEEDGMRVGIEGTIGGNWRTV